MQLNFQPWQGRSFRLRYESHEQDRYLAFVSGLQRDVREKCGRTNYASVGNGEEYANFRWTIDEHGALKAVGGTGDAQACLAAHRTYVSDCQGRDATFLISTVYPGHENKWQLDRYGDLDKQRYLIVLGNSKCVKDKVNMIGWLANAHINGQPNIMRNDDSGYVYVCDRNRVKQDSMPVW